jgi:hypothetical protein
LCAPFICPCQYVQYPVQYPVQWTLSNLLNPIYSTTHLHPFPRQIHRSGVSITNGDLYLNFRVYTQESLSAGLEMKRRVLGQNADAVKEKDEHLEKMNATGNLIMKAIHYRNAFAAFEKVLYAPQAYSFPEYGEAIQLPNGLLVVGEGSINRKGNALLGPSWTKIGTVTLAPYTVVDDKLSKLKP